MSIGTIGYFGFWGDTSNPVGLVTSLGWEPENQRIKPFVVFRNDFIFHSLLSFSSRNFELIKLVVITILPISFKYNALSMSDINEHCNGDECDIGNSNDRDGNGNTNHGGDGDCEYHSNNL